MNMFVVPCIVALIAGMWMWIESDSGWVGLITAVIAFVIVASI